VKQRTLPDSKIARYMLYALPIIIVLVTFVTFVSTVIVNNNRQYILEEVGEANSKVALVLGGGVYGLNLQPTDVVQSRLDAAAELYFAGAIEKILVSGDNRHVDYNEPLVMQNYLHSTYDIPLSSIQQDNAGRSTYESCDRARNVFQLEEMIVVSQQSHLPRALYLCRSFGIEAYGYPATESHQRISQTLREFGANVKAVFNVHVIGEPTLYGDPIPL